MDTEDNQPSNNNKGNENSENLLENVGYSSDTSSMEAEHGSCSSDDDTDTIANPEHRDMSPKDDKKNYEFSLPTNNHLIKKATSQNNNTPMPNECDNNIIHPPKNNVMEPRDFCEPLEASVAPTEQFQIPCEPFVPSSMQNASDQQTSVVEELINKVDRAGISFTAEELAERCRNIRRQDPQIKLVLGSNIGNKPIEFSAYDRLVHYNLVLHIRRKMPEEYRNVKALIKDTVINFLPSVLGFKINSTLLDVCLFIICDLGVEV